MAFVAPGRSFAAHSISPIELMPYPSVTCATGRSVSPRRPIPMCAESHRHAGVGMHRDPTYNGKSRRYVAPHAQPTTVTRVADVTHDDGLSVLWLRVISIVRTVVTIGTRDSHSSGIV